MISYLLDSYYLLLHDFVFKCDADLVEQVFQYLNDVLFTEAATQHNKESNSRNRTASSKLFRHKTSQRKLLTTVKLRRKHEEANKDIVSAGGPLCENQVISDTTV